jgi:hypothetical protein
MGIEDSFMLHQFVDFSGMNVIAYESLKIDRQIGQGNFGVVNLAYWNGKR